MTRTFEDFLQAHQLDGDAIEQGAQYYIAEVSDDPSPDEMRRQMEEAAGDAALLNDALAELARDPQAREQVCIKFLSEAWRTPEERPGIENALLEAKATLPVLDAGLLSMVVMYALYLRATGGRKTRKTTEETADGAKRTTEEEWYPPTGPIRAVIDAIIRRKG
jgi:hypothetical protein